ncbi:hypothetical protein [Streptodolium elevatio]|uniref:Lipoprotein n=1 Tax=Streptodolium elevatio TaxID=3157996 RepID=A0ABV3DN68_9ACTN
MARKTPAISPALAALAAAVVVVTAGCGGDDGDDNTKKLADWAGKVCTTDVTGRIDASKKALDDIGTVVSNETPEALKARLAADVAKLAEANTAFAAALDRAGPPEIKDGRAQMQVLTGDLRATAAGWTAVTTKLEELPTGDQKAFADALRALEPTISSSLTVSRAALDKLHQGALGKALAGVPGCVSGPAASSGVPSDATPETSPAPPADPATAPPASAPEPPEGSPSASASVSGSTSPSASSSASSSTSASARP